MTQRISICVLLVFGAILASNSTVVAAGDAVALDYTTQDAVAQDVTAQHVATGLERGIAAFEQERFDEAEQAFRTVLENDPDNADAHFFLARVLFTKGDAKSAARSITRALRIEPENVDFLDLQLAIGFPNEFIKAIRDAKISELAERILRLDSLNVRSNLHLGLEQALVWLDQRKRMSLEGAVKRLLDPFDVARQLSMGATIKDQSQLAKKAYPEAVQHFKQVLSREPGHLQAIQHLAALYLTANDLTSLQSLARHTQRVGPSSMHGWLLGGYSANQGDRYNDAEGQFARALGIMPDSIRAVFEDLDRIRNEEEIDIIGAGEELDPDVFWLNRDPRQLTPHNERLLEHYSRLTYATYVFPEPDTEKAGWNTDRGQIYVRYGPPTNEHHLWDIVKEVACGDINAYSRFHLFQYAEFKFVFGKPPQAGRNEYHTYAPCSQLFETFPHLAAVIDYVIISRNNIRETPEQFEPDGAGRVEFPYLVNVFKGDDGGAQIYVPYGVRVPFIPPQDGLKLPLRTGAFLLSEDAGLMDDSRRDMDFLEQHSLFEFKEASFWFDVHGLDAKPGGNQKVSVEFETAESGAIVGYHQTNVEVPDFSGSDLMISDLMLAYSIEESTTAAPQGHIVRDDLLIRPAPWGVYANNQPLYFYFELYNLGVNTGEARYRVEAVLVEDRGGGLDGLIRRAFGRRADGVSLTFDEQARTADVGRYFIMDVRDQERGTYVLAVRATDRESNETVEARRTIILE